MPDTIAAIATASAAAAVGIVRLSGAETRCVLAALFTPVDGRSAAELPPRRMTYGTVRDAEGRTLDHALAVVFSAGHSYTGEESAELHCHGSPVVLQEVLRAAFAAGARQARAGEFTRAGVSERQNGPSPRRRRSSTSLTPRPLRRRGTPPPRWTARCAARSNRSTTRCWASPAASTPWWTIPTRTSRTSRLPRRSGRSRRANKRSRLCSAPLRADACSKAARRPPSSARRTRAKARCSTRSWATTAPSSPTFAGTTRDTVEEKAVVGGVLLRLIDTAGIRETDDAVERLGVERSRRAVESADLVIVVADGSHTPLTVEPDILALAAQAPHWILAISKDDRNPAVKTAVWRLPDGCACAGASGLL